MAHPKYGDWYYTLDPRQKAMVDHAISYAQNYSHAGVPGHGAHLLIATLAQMLNTKDGVSPDEVEHDA